MTRPDDKKPARSAANRPDSKGPTKDASKGKKPYKRGIRPQDIKRDQKIKEGETRPGDRIAKVLSRAGVASRRDAEVMITEGRVTVNGRVINSPAFNVLPKDRITVDGQEVREAEPPRLWLYHKPTGLVTTAKDEKGRETVFDALPKDLPRVMSVGRLDLNSEGLLLLTNDGELKRKLELPDTGWMRKYRVRVKGTASEATLDKLRKGITSDGEDFLPMEVVFDRQQGANAWLTVGLREGKNREIRRAMEEIGLTVNRLIRISYGPFRLNTIKPGEVEEVRARVLRDQLGLEMDEAGKPKREVSRGGRDDQKPFNKKPFAKDGDRPHRDRGGDRDGDRKPYGKRDGEDRPFRKRNGDDRGGFKGKRDGDRKPYGKRDGEDRPFRKRDGDDRGGFKGKRDGDRKPYGKRDGEDRPFRKRDGDDRGGFKGKRDGDRKPYGKRDGEDRPFRKRDGDDRGGFKGNRDGDRKPYGKRDGDDRGGYKGKRDGDDRGGFKGKRDGDRKPYGKRDDKRDGDRKPRSAGFKSHGGGKTGKPRSSGFKSHGDSARKSDGKSGGGTRGPNRNGGKPKPRS